MTGYIPVRNSGYDYLVKEGFYQKAPYAGRELAIQSLTASAADDPALQMLERRLAALDGSEAALAFASGMAAISALFPRRRDAGGHLVLQDVCC